MAGQGIKETLALIRENFPEEPLLGREVSIESLRTLLREKGIKGTPKEVTQLESTEEADYARLDRLVRQGDSALFAFLQEIKNKRISRENLIKLLRIALQVPRGENLTLMLWDRVDKPLLSEKIVVLAVKGKSLKVMTTLLDYFESPPLDEALLATLKLKRIPLEILELLLDRGANPENSEILQLALKSGSIEIFRTLIREVNDQDLLREIRAFTNEDQEVYRDLIDDRLP